MITSPKSKFEIKPENVNVFEIETVDQFDPESLPEDEAKELAAKNAAFEQNILIPALLDRATPCQCQMGKIVERTSRRRMLQNAMPVNGQMPLEITQEDIDTRAFGVVLLTHKGEYKDILVMISQCKACKEIHIWGDIDIVTYALAKAAVEIPQPASRYMPDDYKLETIPEEEVTTDGTGETEEGT